MLDTIEDQRNESSAASGLDLHITVSAATFALALLFPACLFKKGYIPSFLNPYDAQSEKQIGNRGLRFNSVRVFLFTSNFLLSEDLADRNVTFAK